MAWRRNKRFKKKRLKSIGKKLIRKGKKLMRIGYRM